MKFKIKKCALLVALATSAALPSMSSQAAGTITFGEDKSISIGLGLRTAFTSTEDAAPNGNSRSKDFDVDDARIYINASLNKYIKGTFNTFTTTNATDGQDSIRTLDAYVQFEFMDEFNIWMGQLLPPTDRANLDGPFYLNAWSYPGVASRYQNKFVGRDIGVTVWGKLFDKRLVYSVGAFEGNRVSSFNSNSALNPNRSDNLMFSGRLQYDFLDAGNDPAYYTSSVYYGKDVLSVALVGMFQKDAVGVAGASDDYKAYNIDAVFEKKFSAGVLNLEGAAYKYNFSDSAVAADAAAVVAGGGSFAGAVPGKAYLGVASWMFGDTVGWGKFQPYARYQKFDVDGNIGADQKEYDIGLNYIIDGHNARISTVYTKTKTQGISDIDRFTVGLQLQF
ncbi:OprO/OprP family phosphate-selective porin [Methylobacillus caricis]|uniref:porin n=1 Tax=Methylobacillus caricis TaxID=1971611 RepID=UPI001CFF9644|nr:porin [Methylobacillus caricis]MCB5187128.1 OprO/OprP family phosphate-selective porin [Methylobacillus caricis]